MKRKRIINKICNHAEHCSRFDSFDNLMPDMEQFMRKENKMALNEPTAGDRSADADHYLHSSTPFSTKYDCRSNVSAWERYFPLNGD